MVLSFLELVTHGVGDFRTVPVPPDYPALKQDTPQGIVAEYPLGYSDIYRLWQRVHGRPLVNGAPDGSLADQARFMILDPAQAGTAQTLALLGVTAVAIHPGDRRTRLCSRASPQPRRVIASSADSLRAPPSGPSSRRRHRRSSRCRAASRLRGSWRATSLATRWSHRPAWRCSSCGPSLPASFVSSLTPRLRAAAGSCGSRTRRANTRLPSLHRCTSTSPSKSHAAYPSCCSRSILRRRPRRTRSCSAAAREPASGAAVLHAIPASAAPGF